MKVPRLGPIDLKNVSDVTTAHVLILTVESPDDWLSLEPGDRSVNSTVTFVNRSGTNIGTRRPMTTSNLHANFGGRFNMFSDDAKHHSTMI